MVSTSSVANTASVIVQAGYLVRTVSIDGTALQITGDINTTVPMTVIGAPSSAEDLYFNGVKLDFTTDEVTGEWLSTLEYTEPSINLPDLSTLDWKYTDDLPEIQSSYDDSLWTLADHITTNNTKHPLMTPTSLYASDYGYNAGVLIYRGHLTALGNESTFYVWTQGGTAYASSVWINSTYLGSWAGNDVLEASNNTYTLPKLQAGEQYVITVLVDNTGLEENWAPGEDQMKYPRGILNYNLNGGSQSQITWKLTGNLGGEDYVDKVRGPLNEGGFYAERQGFTQPDPPSANWDISSPENGFGTAGVRFYQTSFNLDLPQGFDIPLTFNFANTTMNGVVADYRALLWVNGYQFGKYVSPELVALL